MANLKKSPILNWTLLTLGGTFVMLQVTCASAEDFSSSSIVIFEETDSRIKSPNEYFSHEYERLNTRRMNFQFQHSNGGNRPPMIVGLALSGGGIRSNAFQMGLMSGLHTEKVETASLLDRIDYTSSVSGGSWANVAIWAWPDNLSEMFNCLDSAARLGKERAIANNNLCSDAVQMLRTQQKVNLLASPGHQRKEEWEKDITQAHLRRGCNVRFTDVLPENCANNVVQKPYFIINSTHSAASENPGIDGFPFETTLDGTGTVVDEGSTLPKLSHLKKKYAGFYIRFRNSDIRWDRRKYFQALTPGGKPGLIDGSKLSLIAAHSSAVIKGSGIPAAFLSFYFQISEKSQPKNNPSLRKEYKLTDGGKSDNTGILALVDRGADLIVASYMGKEGEPYEDLDVAKKQSIKLFGCFFSEIDLNPTIRSQEGYFVCPKAPNGEKKSVLHLHPRATNINDFMLHLESRVRSGENEIQEIIEYLRNEEKTIKDEKDRFPQTPTLVVNYDERLIRAYYLLGKYSAIKDISPYLRKVLLAK